MPELKHYDNLGTARFITFSCYKRLKLLTEPTYIEILLKVIAEARDEYKFELLAYVIMPSHVHMIIIPAENSKVGRIIGEIKRKSAYRILSILKVQDTALPGNLTKAKDGIKRHIFWQPRCYDHNCRTIDTIIEKINYCHNNPVRAGLATSPERYPWSSYGFYSDNCKVILDIDPIDI